MKCERCEREIPKELYSITERGLMLSATGHWTPFSFCKSCKKELDSWFFEYGKHRCDERMNDNENKTTLSAEKTTITDTDMISRTDPLNAIWQKEYGKDYDGVNMLDIPHIDIIENMPSADGDLKAEIDKLPRIKVGNSNSPTVKYCIDERLLYEILEKMEEE